MPLNDPTVTASCDECGIESLPMKMVAVAGGAWYQRYVEKSLQKQGWLMDGEKTICYDCRPDGAEDA